MKRIVLGMTGATGAVLGIELLRQLQRCAGVETHLVLSRWARATIHLETELSARDVESLADAVYSWDDQSAAISSGSFRTDGMVIAPCSMKTLAAIRTGYADGLIARAADVTLKERRRLVLVARETPLSQIHLENMLDLARMGASIVPPMMPPIPNGSTTLRTTPHLVAPSAIAASRSPRGAWSNTARITAQASAPSVPGRISTGRSAWAMVPFM